MTKDQQFNQEERALTNAMDRESETKSKLREDNKLLLTTMEEIAVPYPETNTPEQDKILCEYLIARAQDCLIKLKPKQTEENNLHPLFQAIADQFTLLKDKL